MGRTQNYLLKLEKQNISNLAVPSAPGAPQVIHVDKSMITLVWLQPDREGDAGPVLGYVVEFRRLGDGANWYPTHTGLVQDTQFTGKLLSLCRKTFMNCQANVSNKLGEI